MAHLWSPTAAKSDIPFLGLNMRSFAKRDQFGPLLLKHLKNMQLFYTQPYICQCMFTKLYLSLKTIDNLKCKF